MPPHALWRQLFNPAGGVPYHFRALTNQRQGWAPFRAEIARWLGSWQPPETHLALVGPSGGYNLPLRQLRRYERITVFEPDPVACLLLQRNMRRRLGVEAPPMTFIRTDHLVAHPARLVEFLERNGAAVLFCNVLGQLVHLVPAAKRAGHLDVLRLAVKQMLEGRSWATFHDRVSGPLAPKIVASTALRRWSDQELIKRAYDVHGRTQTVELSDHHTEGYVPEHLPHRYITWHIARDRYHLIEAVHSCG
jgi:hypothetical protein